MQSTPSVRSQHPCLRAALLGLAMFTAAPLCAQEIRATVGGTVTDGQGAVTPGVTVTAMNVDTNVSSDATTDENGRYSIRQLAPGRYRVTAALQGFKTFAREGIELRTAETATINIALTLGALEETVVVHAALSAIESDQSTLAQTMENKRIAELPLNGRQVYMLLQLTSGTYFTQTTFGATGFSGTRAWDVNGSLSIHGSRTSNNEFLIDGAPSAGTGGGTGSWNYAPPVDAIEEFRVQTASVDASYGRTSGGIVNLTLRSGTNTLRGSAITHYRGTALDSNQIQNIRNSISNEGHKYHNVEGMVSGPVRRNKLFFMGGYQGFYENIPFPATRTVPTEAQLRGDFSQTFDAQGRLIQIFDPATTRPNPSGTGFLRDAFPNNQIPQTRIHPIAAQLASFMPRSNAHGSVTGQDNFISSPNLGRYRYNSYLMRFDQVFSDKHRLSVSNTGNWGIEYRNENALPEPAIRSDNYPTHRNHYLLTLDDTYILGPTTILNTRFSFDRFDEPHEKEFGDIDPNLPFTGTYQATGPLFPQINFEDRNFYEDMFPRTFRRPKNDAWSLLSSVAKTMGPHTFKTGGEYRAYNFARTDEVASNGLFEFTRGFTRRDALNNDGTGSELASFLLGLPSGGRVTLGTPRTEQYRYVAVFVQDDWKVNGRTTINLGLRWDYQSPLTEANDQIVTGFDRTSTNPLQQQIAPGTINPATGQPLNLVGGLLFANRGGPSAPYKKDWNNLQPRVSASYRVTQKVVARANYGRSYLGLSSSGQAGGSFLDFQRDTPFVSSNDGGITPATPWANPFPAGFQEPRAGELGLATLNGQGLNFVDPGFTVPFTDQWMAGVDLELPWNVGLDVAYVGNEVSGLPVQRNINLIPQSERDRAIARLGGNPAYLNQTFANPFAGLLPGTGINAATATRNQLLRPFPQFNGDINMTRTNIGSQTYHALEAVATKRYSNGVMVAVNYTLANLKSKTDLLNPYDAETFQDYSSDMRRHRVAITGLVDLPFGPGRKFGGGTRGVVGGLIGGWQVNVIGELQSGRPLGMNGSAILLQDSAKLSSSDQSFTRWFDNSTRTNPRADGTFAWDTIGANDYRQSRLRFPDVNEPTEPQWSVSVFKSTRIRDRVTLQFRVETFNIFNVRLYGGPSTNPTAADFGVVNTASQVNFPRQTQLSLRVQF